MNQWLKSLSAWYKNDFVFMALIAFMYLLVGLAYVKTRGYIGTDGCVYALGTEGIARGEGFSRFGDPLVVYMPFYSFVSVPFYLVFNNSETATRLVSFLAALATIPFLFYLVKDLFGSSAARIASFLVFTNTHYIKYSTDVLTESLFLLLVIAATYVYVHNLYQNKACPKRWWTILIFALLSGLATLTRPDGLLFFILLLFLFAIKSKESLKMRIAKIAICGLIFIIVLVPHLTFQYRHTGKVQLTDKLHNQLLSGDYIAFEDKEAYYKHTAFRIYDELGLPLPPDIHRIPETIEFSTFQYLVENWRHLMKRGAYNLVQFGEFINEGLLVPTIWLFFIAGLLLGIQKRERRSSTILLLTFFLPIFPLALSHFELRYILPQLLCLLIIAALGFDIALKKAKKADLKIKGPVLVLAVATLIYYPIDDNLKYIKEIDSPNRYTIYKEAGRWLREHVGKPDEYTSMATKPWIPFYARMPSVSLPAIESSDIVVTYLQKKGFDFLIIDKEQIEDNRPGLKDLLNVNELVRGLDLVYHDKDRENTVMIYKVLQGS